MFEQESTAADESRVSTEQVNPYASPIAVVDERTQLSFDGVIDEDDYAQLLPSRDAEWLLYTLLVFLLALTTVLLLPAIIVALIIKGWDNVVLPVIPIGLATAAGTIFTIRFRRPLRRARRALKRFPDLLGVSCGQLTESGLAFHDGTRQHWFGSQHLLASVVSSAGIRIYVDDDPRRFLALTSRLFDQYSEPVAKRLQQGWRDAAADAASPGVPAGLAMWQELNRLPDDAIPFSGTVNVQHPLRSPQVLRAAAADLIVALGCLVAGIWGSEYLVAWVRYSCIGFGGIVLVLNGRKWWRYSRGMGVQAWSQQGWVSSDELAILRLYTGVKISLSEIDHVTDYGGLMVLTSHSGGSYYLARDHVQSDEEWLQIKIQFGTRCVEN